MLFPFERVATTGVRALATWEELKTAGRGVPVVIGNDESVEILSEAFNSLRPKKPSLAEILAAADSIGYPGGLIAESLHQSSSVHASPTQDLVRHLDGRMIVSDGSRFELTPEEFWDLWAAMPDEPPPVGEWPAEPSPSVGLTVAIKYDRTPLPEVQIALIPTDDWTTIPAHLRWGGWNGCPRAEYHVAALRSWRNRFGAELIGLSSDRMDLRVARRPDTREQALELAREQYIYCKDIVDQGEGTLSGLAACLISDDWWNFWWD